MLSLDSPSVFIPNSALLTHKFSYYKGNPLAVSEFVIVTVRAPEFPATVAYAFVFVTS